MKVSPDVAALNPELAGVLHERAQPDVLTVQREHSTTRKPRKDQPLEPGPIPMTRTTLEGVLCPTCGSHAAVCNWKESYLAIFKFHCEHVHVREVER